MSNAKLSSAVLTASLLLGCGSDETRDIQTIYKSAVIVDQTKLGNEYIISTYTAKADQNLINFMMSYQFYLSSNFRTNRPPQITIEDFVISTGALNKSIYGLPVGSVLHFQIITKVTDEPPMIALLRFSTKP